MKSINVKSIASGVAAIACLGAIPVLDGYVTGVVASFGVAGVAIAGAGYFGYYAWKKRGEVEIVQEEKVVLVKPEQVVPQQQVPIKEPEFKKTYDYLREQVLDQFKNLESEEDEILYDLLEVKPPEVRHELEDEVIKLKKNTKGLKELIIEQSQASKEDAGNEKVNDSPPPLSDGDGDISGSTLPPVASLEAGVALSRSEIPTATNSIVKKVRARCFVCNRLAKKEKASDGNNYCTKHELKEVVE